MKGDRPESPRFIVSVAEMLIVVAILSGFCAFLLPAVNAARRSRNLPLLLPLLQPLHEDNPWPFIIGTPIVVTALVATFLGIIRLFLPKAIRSHFTWKKAAPTSLVAAKRTDSAPEPVPIPEADREQNGP